MAKTKIPDDVRMMSIQQMQQELEKAKDSTRATELALLIRECPEGEQLLRQVTVLLLRMTELRSQLASLEAPSPEKVEAERKRCQSLIDFNQKRADAAPNDKMRQFYLTAVQNHTASLQVAGLPAGASAFVSLYKTRQLELQALADEWAEALPTVDLLNLLPDVSQHLPSAEG
jgi:ribosomal protein L29